MRIGIDAHLLGKGKGGVETFLYNLIRAISTSDPEDDYFIYVGNGHNLVQEELSPKLHIRVLPTTNPWFERLALIPYVYRRDRLDVIHLQRAIPIWGCKTSVLHIHDIMFETNPEIFGGSRHVLKRYLFRRSALRSACIATDSQASKADIMKHYGIPATQIHVAEGGVDRTIFYVERQSNRSLLERYGIFRDFILFVGALERNKNLHGLLTAFADLRKRKTEFSSLQLVVCGPRRNETRSGYYQEIEHRLNVLEIRNSVLFVGRVPIGDLRGLMCNARTLVFPSLAEGFGLPPLEAMACGTPVVASKILPIMEVCADAALLVPPGDLEALANAMQHVLEDKALAEILSKKGLDRAAQFTWERTALKYIQIYRAARLGCGT